MTWFAAGRCAVRRLISSRAEDPRAGNLRACAGAADGDAGALENERRFVIKAAVDTILEEAADDEAGPWDGAISVANCSSAAAKTTAT